MNADYILDQITNLISEHQIDIKEDAQVVIKSYEKLILEVLELAMFTRDKADLNISHEKVSPSTLEKLKLLENLEIGRCVVCSMGYIESFQVRRCLTKCSKGRFIFKLRFLREEYEGK